MKDNWIIWIAIAVIMFVVGFLSSPTTIEHVIETVVVKDEISYAERDELKDELAEANLQIIGLVRQLEGYKDICNIDIVIKPGE